jgi:hypothetical protein
LALQFNGINRAILIKMDSKKVKENYMDEMMTKPKWKYVNEFGEESELRRRHYINNENNCKKRKKHRGTEDDADDKYFNIEKDDKEEVCFRLILIYIFFT